MKLALYLPNFRTEVTIKELEDLTELAEELDFDSVWTLDRIVVPEASDRGELQYSFGMMDGLPNALPVASNGGTVTVNADGSFSYVTAAGYTGATETFQYRIRDAAGLTGTATVTITLGGRVWYVQGGATNGDGRSNTPFNSPASASAAVRCAPVSTTGIDPAGRTRSMR